MGSMTALSDTDSSWVVVQDPGAEGALRRAAVRLGQLLGLTESRVGDIGIVATELGSNLHKHAIDGLALVRAVRRGGQGGVEIVATDKGPGMVDLSRSAVDGHSTSGTLGIGLGAVTRLSSELDIYSRPDRGTVIAATLWGAKTPAPLTGLDARGIGRPMGGEEVSGDGYAVRLTPTGYPQLLVCDGLGHGPLAAIAARTAETAFLDAPPGPPKELLDLLHRALRHTRGAVATIVEVNPETERLTFAGLGNISGAVIHNGQKRMMSTQPGIAGHQRPTLREVELPCPPTAVIVLHTDGVSDRWSLDPYPGLEQHTSLVIAATLLRDASARRDDSAILVAKVRP
jgi:anti-sigma regulatory factor (Ser/Thr protein kinase)